MVIQCKHKKDPWFVYEKLALKNNDNNDIYIKCDQYWHQVIPPKEIAAFSLEKFEKCHLYINLACLFVCLSVCLFVCIQ